MTQDLPPVFGIDVFLSFLSRNRFFCFQLSVVFLGLHCRALVFYSDGDIVGHRHFQNIDHYNDFVRA